LAGGIAHDFNNLLTVIAGYSQMTLDALPGGHHLRANVEQVLEAAERATNLTRQLLAFSRRQPSRTETVVLNELVASIQNMLQRLIGEDVSLVVSLDPAAGCISVDVGHIEQVIMNLVVNARDAMPHGGKLIIETSRQVVVEHYGMADSALAPGEYLALTVSDTGTGISANVRAHLFDPFFTTKQPGKGTGLGLSTVYGIVKQCGGSIAVDSEPGRGSKFTILLPVKEAPPCEAAAHAVPREAGVRPVTPVRSGSETILLAEDEAIVRRFLRESLEQYGYRVLECSNGLEAMERARHYPASIHLLLTDLVMPGMGGAELAAQFSACHPGVPVLCLSGYSEVVWPLAAGSFLQKPVTPAVLLTRVRALLDHAEVPLPG
jgi:two-component system cell cycle sensor histidine kinase/response regulator CckA